MNRNKMTRRQLLRLSAIAGTGALIAACGAALVSLVLYLIFKHSAAVLNWLGEIGTMVMIRLMAFILLCIGIQIMWNGWAELNGITSLPAGSPPLPGQ